MVDHSLCIECGGNVIVSFPSLTERVEECRECSRRSHWRVCLDCGEMNGPRRVICLECGLPFEGKASRVTASASRNHAVQAANFYPR